MLAPQFLQVIPIDDVGAEPIGVELIIGAGDIALEAVDGLNLIAITPPAKPRRKPTISPPTAVNQLSIDKTTTTAPQILALFGLELIIIPPKITTSPIMTPTTPTIVTLVPDAPPFAR